MKRTLVASLVAAAFSTPAGATPMSLLDDLLAGIGGGDEAVVVHKEVLAAADEARVHAEAMRRWSEDFSHELRAGLATMYAPRLSGSRVVKGAPYSAEMITETHQALADGNTITHKTVGAVYRDTDGRTRQESGGDGKKKASVYINDPVEGRHIVLMPESKHAVVTPRVMPLAQDKTARKEKQVYKFGNTEIRIEDGKVFVDGKEAAPGKVETVVNGKQVRVENGRITLDGREIGHGEPLVIRRSIDEKETGDGTRREEIRVQVVRSGDKAVTMPVPPAPPVPPMPPEPLVAPMAVPLLPPMPGVNTLRFESMSRLGKGATTQLPAKDFEGVRAEGKQTVWTIPAGEIGNAKPIQITSETWYSPDLKVTVYSRYHDPRTGESIYRLANIRRAEPARDLFAIPEGYETKKSQGERLREKREERREERREEKR